MTIEELGAYAASLTHSEDVYDVFACNFINDAISNNDSTLDDMLKCTSESDLNEYIQKIYDENYKTNYFSPDDD